MNVRLFVYVVLIAGLALTYFTAYNKDSTRVQTNVTASVMLENDTARGPTNRNASARFSELVGKIRAPTIAESVSGPGTFNVPAAPLSGPPTVFILAFYRTGSTFTASVLASHPGTFYVYEPWYYIDIKYKTDGRSYATFANGTKRLVTVEYKEILRREELRAWATCNLKNLPLEQFQNDVHFARHDSLGDFRRCRYTHSSNYCIEELEGKCRKAPLRVFKFIRLRMKHIEGMIIKYPNVKFIHLMRDPRGNVVSQNHGKPTDMVIGSTWYCKTQRNEISDKQRIFSNSPQRIYTIQYEHLAEHPLKYTSEMLQFVGLQLTKSSEDYIHKIALGGTEAKCVYCVERGNASRMASKWRLEVTLPVVLSINEVCGDIIDLLGYKRFDSEQELKDLTIPNTADL